MKIRFQGLQLTIAEVEIDLEPEGFEVQIEPPDLPPVRWTGDDEG